MQTAQVIPFRFESREVRTLLIDDRPWFVASDVALALMYSEAKDMTRNLDDDEKGRQIVPTLGGEQEMLVINESGLYSAILRSRKTEAKRFKKWVTAEVLPAIRKHGRYEDQGQMRTLIGQTIGTDGFRCLGAVLDGKLRQLPAPTRRRAKMHVWAQMHKAFSVVSAQDIPADQMDAARNFIAAYALEGEWLAAEQAKPIARLNLHYPASWLAEHNPHAYQLGYQPQGQDPRIHITAAALYGMDVRSPSRALFAELASAGYDVEACRLEVMAMQHHLEKCDQLCRALQQSIDRGLHNGITFKLTEAAQRLR
jgi:hypothetical protein